MRVEPLPLEAWDLVSLPRDEHESGDLGPKVPTGEREGPLIRDDSVGTRLAHVPAFMLQAT